MTNASIPSGLWPYCLCGFSLDAANGTRLLRLLLILLLRFRPNF